MNNDLKLFHDILFLGLRPWKNRNFTDDKFTVLYSKLQKVHFAFQPLYEVIFPKPLTPKRKYYHLLIDTEVTRYLNNFYIIFTGASNAPEKSYWLHSTLTKKIIQKFNEISKVINDNQYYFDNLSSKLKDKNIDSRIQDEIYIIQFLKFQLIRMYLEIQNNFSDFLTFDALTENELHEAYFMEPAPDQSMLKDAPKINLPPAASLYKEKPVSSQFKAITNDFRPEKKGIIDYTTIIKNPERFARFEEQLFSNELIDPDYNFKDIHGQKQLLAAIYHTLITKNYFNKKIFAPVRDIKPVDIRKFLDHRYNASLDKQFRIWGKSSTDLANFIEKFYWVDKLPTC